MGHGVRGKGELLVVVVMKLLEVEELLLAGCQDVLVMEVHLEGELGLSGGGNRGRRGRGREGGGEGERRGRLRVEEGALHDHQVLLVERGGGGRGDHHVNQGGRGGRVGGSVGPHCFGVKG